MSAHSLYWKRGSGGGLPVERRTHVVQHIKPTNKHNLQNMWVYKDTSISS